MLRAAELFEPGTQTFVPTQAMEVARVSHAAALLDDGRVLISGGWTGKEVTATAEIYDPITERWASAGAMLEARASHSMIRLDDGRLLVVGGGGGGLGDLESAELFDPVEGSFERTNEMRVPRVKHGTALLGDGTVLIIGGSDDRGFEERFASTEIYHPTTGRFSPGPAMRFGRHKLRDAVAVLPDGVVVVGGGAVRPEVFDPRVGAFRVVDGVLDGSHMFATATPLETGDVLILGGYDREVLPSAGAWLVQRKQAGPSAARLSVLPGEGSWRRISP